MPDVGSREWHNELINTEANIEELELSLANARKLKSSLHEQRIDAIDWLAEEIAKRTGLRAEDATGLAEGLIDSGRISVQQDERT